MAFVNDDEPPIYETIMDDKLGSPSFPTDDAIQMVVNPGYSDQDQYQYQPYPTTTGAPPHNLHGAPSSKYDVLGQTPGQAGYTGTSQVQAGNNGTQLAQSGYMGTASDQEGYMVPSLRRPDYKGTSGDEPGYAGLSTITRSNNSSLPYKVSGKRTRISPKVRWIIGIASVATLLLIFGLSLGLTLGDD